MLEALKAEYFTESKQILADLEPYLLELEVTAEEAEPELIGRLFRCAHAIKSGACYLHLSLQQNMAQALESVLSLIRDGELASSADSAKVVIRGFSSLFSLLNGEAEDSDVEAAIVALHSLAKSVLAEELQNSLESTHLITLFDGTPAFSIPQFVLNNCRDAGTFLYVIEFDMQRDVVEKDINPLKLLTFLQKSGHVLDAFQANEFTLYVLFGSILEPDLINAVFQIDTCQIHPTTVDELLTGSAKWECATTYLDEVEEPLVPLGRPESLQEVDALLAQYDLAMKQRHSEAMDSFEPWDGNLGGIGGYYGAGNGPELMDKCEFVPPSAEQVANHTTDVEGMAELEAELDAALMAEAETFAIETAAAKITETADGSVFSAEKTLPSVHENDTPLPVEQDNFSEVAFPETQDEAMEEAKTENGEEEGGNTEDIVALTEDSDYSESWLSELAEFDEEHLSNVVHPKDPQNDDDYLEEHVDREVVETPTIVAVEEDSPVEENLGSDEDFFVDDAPEPVFNSADLPEEQTGGVVFSLESEEMEVETVHGFEVVAAAPEVTIKLAEDMTIMNAPRLKDALLDLMQEFSEIFLDMSAVESVDITFVQAVASAHKTAAQRGVSVLSKGGLPQAVTETLEQCGLTEEVLIRFKLEKIFTG